MYYNFQPKPVSLSFLLPQSPPFGCIYYYTEEKPLLLKKKKNPVSLKAIENNCVCTQSVTMAVLFFLFFFQQLDFNMHDYINYRQSDSGLENDQIS